MKELTIIIRPEKLEELKDILNNLHCGGMTISSVMGCGTQKGATEVMNEIKGLHTSINLIPKIKLEVVVEDKVVEELILQIRDRISSGNMGDGKIFIRPMDDAVRIRTGERGNKAL